MDRPRRAQLREQVGPPGLGRDPQVVQPVEELADLGLFQRLGPGPRRAGQPLHRVGRVDPGHPAEEVAHLLGLRDRLEDHQAVPGRRRGHDRCGLPGRLGRRSSSEP